MEKTIIDIGTKINLADLIQSRLLIQANSGGGKTVICRTLIEESHGKVPFIISDDAGEYYPLKEKFGDIVIIGGQFADVPISMQAVKMLPKFIISNQLNVIIDISDLKKAQREQYLQQFLETMIDLPQQYWKPYLVFIEEAHKYCGEQDKYQVSATAIKELMSGGRKKGYCGILITQRIAKLHKDAAAECNNKFVGRTVLDIDMDRAAKELGFTASSEFTRLSLRDLKPGHFYAYGTSIEPNHVHEVTIKMPQTKIVKSGNIIEIKPKKPSQQILSSLAKLNELPQDAARELKTIQELHNEVGRLNIELKRAKKETKPGVGLPSAKEANQISKLQEQNRELQVRNGQLLAEIREKERSVTALKKAIQVLEERATDTCERIVKMAYTLQNAHGIKIPEPGQNAPATVSKIHNNVQKTISSVPKRPIAVSTGNGSLGKCSREIIRFLAQYEDREFTKAQVGIATGYSTGSGGFNNSLGELNQRGFIIRDGKLRVNRDAMDQIIESVGEIVPQEYNIETYKSNLGKCEREIYEVLLNHPEQSFTKEELSMATETKYSHDSGGFNNSLGRLNILELIHRDRGQIKLNPELLELM
jgi:hypothetical protein